MNLIALYKGLSDGQRLRIVNLLGEGPLCVCHLMEILGSEQVKISKQLRYLKELGLVTVERQAQWRVYQLAEPENPLLRSNLDCLQAGSGGELPFTEDLHKRSSILARLAAEGPDCAETVLSGQRSCCS
jgi:ArsR family transcriptional regulator